MEKIVLEHLGELEEIHRDMARISKVEGESFFTLISSKHQDFYRKYGSHLTILYAFEEFLDNLTHYQKVLETKKQLSS